VDSIPLENVSLLDLEGRQVRLREFAGRPLLIIFLRHLA
jgi:hypothetical protein